MPPARFVYAISSSATGPVKIGIARDVQRRLQNLQTGHPDPLTVRFQTPESLNNAADIERRIHDLLSKHHRYGEWFNVSAARAISTIKDVLNQTWTESGEETAPIAWQVRSTIPGDGPVARAHGWTVRLTYGRIVTQTGFYRDRSDAETAYQKLLRQRDAA